jgi:hypothetical protein
MFRIWKRYFYGNARTDRCLGSNNSSTVILTEVSTVTTKGSLRSNGRIYKKGLHSKEESRISLRGEKSWYDRNRRKKSRIDRRVEHS